MVLQAILFDKRKFTKKKASKWMKDHNKKSVSMRETKNFYRFRIMEPRKNGNYRIKSIADGVKIIFEPKK